jgi:hypothetical protein
LIVNNFLPRGVLQTLIEKHFPAPDRSRINRLIGLEINKKGLSLNNNCISNEAGSSSGKRKPGDYIYIIINFLYV